MLKNKIVGSIKLPQIQWKVTPDKKKLSQLRYLIELNLALNTDFFCIFHKLQAGCFYDSFAYALDEISKSRDKNNNSKIEK